MSVTVSNVDIDISWFNWWNFHLRNIAFIYFFIDICNFRRNIALNLFMILLFQKHCL